MTRLDTPLKDVIGTTATVLEKAFDLHTAGDLLRH